MAVISVEVPDKIAKKFKPYTIVTYENLLSNNKKEAEWIDFNVNMNAQDFLKSLKTNVLDYKN